MKRIDTPNSLTRPLEQQNIPLHHLAGQPPIVPPDQLRGVAVDYTVMDEASDCDPS